MIAMTISAITALLFILLTSLWYAGYLDETQRWLENTVLTNLGENRLSFGLKSAIKENPMTDDQEWLQTQHDVADATGAFLAKGGAGESVAEYISKAI